MPTIITKMLVPTMVIVDYDCSVEYTGEMGFSGHRVVEPAEVIVNRVTLLNGEDVTSEVPDTEFEKFETRILSSI